MEQTYNPSITYTSDINFPYRRLEYITQPSGVDNTDLLPCLVAPSGSNRFELDFEWTSSTGGIMIGAYTTGQSDYRYDFYVRGSGDVYSRQIAQVHSYTIQWGHTRNRMRWFYTDLYDWDWETNSWDLIGTYRPNPRIYGSWGLFGLGATSPAKPNIKLYAARFYMYGESHVMDPTVQHVLIPCQRKSDGKVGLYDTVEQKFLTSTNPRTGAYDFLAGPTVEEDWDLTDPGYSD